MLFVEDLGESGLGGERGTQLGGDRCDPVVALFLDEFSGFSDGDTSASDDQQADGQRRRPGGWWLVRRLRGG
jgi:hypothetical protein